MVLGPKLEFIGKFFVLLWIGALLFSFYILYCTIYMIVKNRKNRNDSAIAVITFILLLYFYCLNFTFQGI